MGSDFNKAATLNQERIYQSAGNRLSGFIALIRPFFFILTPVNAGSSAVLALWGYPSLRLCVLGAIAVAFSSCTINVFNDFMDRERDKSIWPNRPLPSGRVRPGEALVIVIVSLIISLSIAWFVFNPLTFSILLLAIILGALYSAYLRDKVGYLTLPPIVGLIYLGGWAAFSPDTLFNNFLPWYLYVLAVVWQTAHIMVYYPLHTGSPAQGKPDVKKQPAFFFVPSPKTAVNIGLCFTILTFLLSTLLYFIKPLRSFIYYSGHSCRSLCNSKRIEPAKRHSKPKASAESLYLSIGIPAINIRCYIANSFSGNKLDNNQVDMHITDSVVRKKAEVQSRGVQIPPELISELETSYNAPAIRTGRMVLCFDSPKKGELITAFVVNGKRVKTSPLRLVKNPYGRFEIRADGEKYTDVTLIPHPQFYENVTKSGVPMNKLAVVVGPGHLRSIVHQECFYHQTGRPCRFCAVQHWWDANISKNVSDIAEVVGTGIKEGIVKHISLTTATLDTPGKGLEDLVETTRLIRARAEVPIMLEFEPVDDYLLLDSLLKEAKKAGVTTISCNIECFDEKLRPKIMPAKGKIPVTTYIKTWENALNIFGVNQVFTVAVAGLGETDESILKGIEMAASCGVLTFLVPHSPAIGADYEDMASPSADRMLSLYEQAVEIYCKHGLDLIASRAGCVRGGGFSAITDIARFGAG